MTLSEHLLYKVLTLQKKTMYSPNKVADKHVPQADNLFCLLSTK